MTQSAKTEKYRLSLPVMGSNMTDENIDSYLSYFRKCRVDRVFICDDRGMLFRRDRKAELEHLQKMLNRVRSEGFEAGFWIQAFGFGVPLEPDQKARAAAYTPIRSINGREAENGDAFCPTSEAFMADYLSLVKDLAALKPDCLLLDDDLCLSVRPGIGCFCDEHMRRLNERLGRDCPIETWRDQTFRGGQNAYRDAFIGVMGDTLRTFCRQVRAAADEVDPSLRMGFCAGYTSFDVEGADAIELTDILAGKNRPLLRFTGAPYWITKNMNRFKGQTLGTVIESTRAQVFWCRGKNIDAFHECDSYPRPSYHIPVSYCECFDVALRASGEMGGLKYMMDYYSSPDYETAYIKKHVKDLPLYDFIERHFDGKKAMGVMIADEMRKLRRYDFGDQAASENDVMQIFFSPAAALLSQQTVPCTYEGNEVMAVFGDNARYIGLDKLPKKLLLDMTAAKILAERGWNIGLGTVSPAPVPAYEYFGRERTLLSYVKGRYFCCEPTQDMQILSEFERDGERFPAVIRGKKDETELLILTFDAYSETQNSTAFISYGRSRQLKAFFGNYPLADGAIGLYAIDKVDEETGERAILLVNICEDERDDLTVNLDESYASMEIMGMEGELQGDKVVLKGTLPPFGTVAMVLKKA